jgi:hypothetical protein
MGPQGHADAGPLREPAAASPFVTRFAGLVPARGAVLDVAAGGGRHTRLFLERGHPVLAVDREIGALTAIQAPRLTCLQADLESEPWPLLPVLIEAVEEGGALLYETFAQGNEAFGRPRNPDFLLRPGELLEAVRGSLTVVAYEHGRIEQPRPAVIQRIAAVREPSLSLIGRIDRGPQNP